MLLNTNLNITSFCIDGENEIYICAFGGKIHKLTNSQRVLYQQQLDDSMRADFRE